METPTPPPFSISIACTTCHARLRVRDPSAIGQILTCPKCGSMILVEAPAGSPAAARSSGPPQGVPSAASAARRPPSSPDDQDTVTDLEQDALLPPDERGAPANSLAPPRYAGPVAPPDVAPPDVAPPDAAASLWECELESNADSPTDDPSTVGDAEHDSDVATEPAAADERHADTPKPPPLHWSDRRQTARRNMLLTFGTGLVGILLAVAAYSYFGFGRSGTDASPVAKSTAAGTASRLSAAGAAAAPADSAPSAGMPAGSPDSAAVHQPDPVAPDSPPIDLTLPPAAPGAISPGSVAPGSAPPNPTSNPVPTAAAAPSVGPPDLVPRADGGTGAAPGELTQSLLELGGLLDAGSVAAMPAAPLDAAAAPPAAPPAASDSPAAEPKPAAPVASRPAPRTIDLAARLDDKLLRIQFPPTPLPDFLQTLSELSTIPLTLDYNALFWLKIDPRRTVQLDLQDQTIRAALEAATRPLGLSHQVRGDQVLITLAAPPDDELRQVTYKVDDLAASDPDGAAGLARWIVSLTGEADWEVGGGVGHWAADGGAIVIRHHDARQFQIFRLLEQLRVARGLPTRSRLDPREFRLESRPARLNPALQQPISVSFLEPRPFHQVVRRLAQDTGAPIAIHWIDLADEGWNPDARVSVLAGDQPLAAVLDQLLTPMDLDYRVVDGGVLEITTQARVQEEIEFEFYPLADLTSTGETSAAILAAVTELVGAESLRPAGPGVLQVDAASQCLVAALPQPLQRRLTQYFAARKTK